MLSWWIFPCCREFPITDASTGGANSAEPATVPSAPATTDDFSRGSAATAVAAAAEAGAGTSSHSATIGAAAAAAVSAPGATTAGAASAGT